MFSSHSSYLHLSKHTTHYKFFGYIKSFSILANESLNTMQNMLNRTNITNKEVSIKSLAGMRQNMDTLILPKLQELLVILQSETNDNNVCYKSDKNSIGVPISNVIIEVSGMTQYTPASCLSTLMTSLWPQMHLFHDAQNFAL